jgi:probable HAF family extracellular repeat protein
MRHIISAVLLAVVCGCTNESPLTQTPSASANLVSTPSYRIVEFPASLGGTVSRGTSINARGQVAGFSSQPGNLTRHAAVWRDGAITDLLTLGGDNSSVVWPGLNERGTVVGVAETADLDPYNEDWSCSAFFPTVTHHICRGFIWDGGGMHPLPGLGGDNSFATAVNNWGQVVGWAETEVHDPTCNAPQVLQFRAVVWDPGKGKLRQLRPFPGDSTSAATAINDRGQVVGISGECDVAVGEFSARHAVLWQGDQVIDLGNLGGMWWHTPMDINQRGDVVGFSDPPGDQSGGFIAQAFIWTQAAGIQPIHTLAGDPFSEALAVNNQRQVVGVSFGGANGSRAFLWQDGVLSDLNSLIAGGSSDVLQSAQDITEDGRITGRVKQAATGQVVMYIAYPIDTP